VIKTPPLVSRAAFFFVGMWGECSGIVSGVGKVAPCIFFCFAIFDRLVDH
jgi:hypothetical protein